MTGAVVLFVLMMYLLFIINAYGNAKNYKESTEEELIREKEEFNLFMSVRKTAKK